MRRWLAVGAMVVLAACDAPAVMVDAGARDAGSALDAAGEGDAGAVDAGARDAGSDAGELDGGAVGDAGIDASLDSGLDASLDAGADAGGELDAGADAGTIDSGCAGPEVAGDGIDGDCDGMERCYRDADRDGYRTSSTFLSANLACDGMFEASAALPPGDCNDRVASIYPGAAEVCDGYDSDCDGAQLAGEEDEGDGYVTCSGFVDVDPIDRLVGESDCDPLDPTRYRLLGRFPDGDLDGLGVPSLAMVCMGATNPAGWSDVSSDCDDADAFVYPGAPEIPGDGIDQGCAGDGDLVLDESTAVFVSQGCVSPCGAGTRASPVTTIASGISMAGSSRVVVVAEGIYDEELSSSVSLFGGFNADFSMRDPDAFVTRIQGNNRVPLRVTGPAVIQGFTIVYTGTRIGVALYPVGGSNVTALDNVVEATGSATTRAIGVSATPFRARGNVVRGTVTTTMDGYGVDVLDPGFVYLEDNVIEATTTGNGSAVAVHARLEGAVGVLIGNSIRGADAPPSISRFRAGYAIEWEGTRGPTSSSLYLEGNTVRGGDRAWANAIYMTLARLVAVGNHVEGGVGFDESFALQHSSFTHTTAVNNVFVSGPSDASTGESFAVVGPSHGVFVNNTILGGAGGTSRGAVVHPGHTVWVNNLIFCGSGTSAYGMDVSRGGLGAREVVLAFNDFYGAAMDGMVYSSAAMRLRTAAEVDACAWVDCAMATGTLSVTPSFVGGAPFDYHVTSAIAGGDPSAFYAGALDDVDVDGDARPGVDGVYGVGADEGP